VQILPYDCTFISTIILGRYFVIVVVNCDSGPCRFFLGHSNTHRHTHTQPFKFNGLWSGTAWVGQYQKKHSPTHTHPDHQTSFINFLHLLRSIASSVFSLRAWQSFLTTSLQVFLLVLDPLLHTTCISSSSHHLFAARAHTIACCYIYSLSQLLTWSLTPHIHLTILISAGWSATSFSFLTGYRLLRPFCNVM